MFKFLKDNALLILGFSCIWYVVIKLHFCDWGATVGDICLKQKDLSTQMVFPAILMTIGMLPSVFTKWRREQEKEEQEGEEE